MLILLLIFLLVSNAVTLKQEKSILFSRVAITGLICSSYIAFNNLHVQGFNVSLLTQIVLMFIPIVVAMVLGLTALHSGKVCNKNIVSNRIKSIRAIECAFKENLRYLVTCLGISICIYISIKVPHLYIFNTFDVMYFTPVLAGFCGVVYMTFKTNYFKHRDPTRGELIVSSILPMVFTAFFMYVTHECLYANVYLLQDVITVFLISETGSTLCMDNTGSGNASGNPETSVSGSSTTGSNTGAQLLAFGFNNQQWRHIALGLEHAIQNILTNRRANGDFSETISFTNAISKSSLNYAELVAVRNYYKDYFNQPRARQCVNPIWGEQIGRTHISNMNKLALPSDQGANSSDEE